MTPTIGTYSLCAAVLAAAGTLLVSLAAARFGTEVLRGAARRGIYLLAALLTIASGALLVAELTSDFRLSYVVRYTEAALPAGYKLAAFWAGQEGSLLLWGWLLAVMGAGFAFTTRKQQGLETAVALGTLATVIGFFATLMLFAANPFTLVDGFVPTDGQGMNPMLQDPGMIAHPPILFVGYAGFTIPFALAVGALVARRLDGEWVLRSRPWVLISWIFLGAGIILGAQWAYVELGWGGYWAWDPVENASLLPWLTGTALLHSAITQRQRGMFKRWTILLTTFTFILCIFGTYVTRSGVVDSVHTFGKSLVGDFFLIFLIITTLATIALVAWRWTALKSDRPLTGLLTREGIVLAGNCLLVGMMLITLIGTMYPAISRNLFGKSQTVQPNFYNTLVLPLALVLVVLMGVGPLLGYGRTAAARIGRVLAAPAIVALATVIALLALGIRSIWALASGVAAAVVIAAVATDFLKNLKARSESLNESYPTALFRVVFSNHRRYAAQLVHAGLAMVVVGIAGSSLYTHKQDLQLTPGRSAVIGGHTLTLIDLQERRAANFTALEAEVALVDPAGRRQNLRPQHRDYNKHEQDNTEVALRSNWRRDVYVTLAGWDFRDGKRLATLQVLISPLVWWIWVGGLVMTGGALLCLIPRGGSHRVAAEPTAAVTATPAGRDRKRAASKRQKRQQRLPATVS